MFLAHTIYFVPAFSFYSTNIIDTANEISRGLQIIPRKNENIDKNPFKNFSAGTIVSVSCDKLATGFNGNYAMHDTSVHFYENVYPPNGTSNVSAQLRYREKSIGMRKFRYSGIKTGIKILGVYFFRNRKKRSKKRWKTMVVFGG